MLRILLLILVSFSIIACGTWSETARVLRNEKTTSTDEFLVKKRKPLVLPPIIKKFLSQERNHLKLKMKITKLNRY